MIGVELRDADGHPDYTRVEAVKRHARANGLLLLTCGAKIGDAATDNSTLRLIPYYAWSNRELSAIPSALYSVFDREHQI